MLRLVLPVRDVPDGQIVTKPTGNSVLTVKSTITVHRENAEKQEITSGDGCVFLIGERGNISAVTDDTRVALSFSSPQKAIDFLQTLIPEDDK